jgi:hypothetical protein
MAATALSAMGDSRLACLSSPHASPSPSVPVSPPNSLVNDNDPQSALRRSDLGAAAAALLRGDGAMVADSGQNEEICSWETKTTTSMGASLLPFAGPGLAAPVYGQGSLNFLRNDASQRHLR